MVSISRTLWIQLRRSLEPLPQLPSVLNLINRWWAIRPGKRCQNHPLRKRTPRVTIDLRPLKLTPKKSRNRCSRPAESNAPRISTCLPTSKNALRPSTEPQPNEGRLLLQPYEPDSPVQKRVLTERLRPCHCSVSPKPTKTRLNLLTLTCLTVRADSVTWCKSRCT